MHRTKLSFLCSTTVAFAIALTGCGDDGGTSDTAAGSESSTAGTDPTDPTDPTNPTNPTDPTDPTSGTNPTDPTDPTDPTSGTDPTDPTSGTDPTDPDSTGATTEGGSESGTGGGEVCAPDAADDPCTMCNKEMCCAAMEACVAADANCGCVLACLAEMKNPGQAEAIQCAMECGADIVAIAGPLMELQGCQAKMCGKACGA